MESHRKTYKITFLGSQSVGKTSLITQYIYNNLQNAQSTIGIDFFIKNIEFPIQDSTKSSVNIRLKICDTAGQERFQSMISSYTRESFIACIVFDLSNGQSFKDLDMWIKMIKDNCEDAKILFIGNKRDLIPNFSPIIKSTNEVLEDTNYEITEDLKIIRNKIKEKCKELDALYCETSALNINSIDELEESLKKEVEKDLIKNNYYENRSEADVEVLNMEKKKKKKNFFCW